MTERYYIFKDRFDIRKPNGEHVHSIEDAERYWMMNNIDGSPVDEFDNEEDAMNALNKHRTTIWSFRQINRNFYECETYWLQVVYLDDDGDEIDWNDYMAFAPYSA